ncbi:MAG: PDZ domain-containing protein [Fimbriimonadaceae bacterium]|nr:PDZ domain-containing protein [Fimbriimonadaceae bacterium]QYK55227.1 MAG: PDZ domain-containing protein [Fimbriimonadaceae bacterium]
MVKTCLAVISLAGAVAGPGQQAAALEDPLWARVKPTVIRITGGSLAAGTAVQISPEGLFLALGGLSASGPVTAQTMDGALLSGRILKTDVATQLCLIQIDTRYPGMGRGVEVAFGTLPGAKIIAATSAGPMHGQLVSSSRIGVLAETRRFAPLSEVRLESGLAPVGGAVVFDEDGRLVGVLGATLAPETAAPRAEGMDAAPARAKNIADRNVQSEIARFGPQGMTVAYTLSPKVLRRVVEGFQSPGHVVHHPSVGLLFTASAYKPGAQVESVTPGSGAAKAGILPGDLIVEANGKTVRDPAGLASILFDLEIGDSLKLQVVRGQSRLSLEAVVGSQDGQL